MITLTNGQKLAIESCLYLFGAGILWKSRKVTLNDSLTTDYDTLAISHVLFAGFIRCYSDKSKDRDDIEGRALSILLGTLSSVTFLLPDPEGPWSKASVSVTASSMLAAGFVRLISESPKKDKK
ncbi:MAG: hypothetical protein AAGE99_04850 [Chlamydiota bacterium]